MSELLYCPWCKKLSVKMSKNGYCQKCFEAKLVCFIEQSELTDLKAKYQKAVEGLKFYADGDGEVLDWDRVNKQGCEQDRGWFARQTLAELGEKE